MASKKDYGIEEHIYETLLDLYKLECSEAFRFPVDTVTCKCPDYYNIITDPMDLSTLTTKYKDGAYRTIDDVKEQVIKIIRNCRTFNSDPTHVIHKTCDKFEKCFYSRWNKLEELRMSIGVPNDYQLQVQMSKLDLIEQRRHKKKEPALLQDQPRPKRLIEPKQFTASFVYSKPDQPMPRQIKIKSSSIQDDDQPFIDSNQQEYSRIDSQQFPELEKKISFKKPIDPIEPPSFKIQLPRPEMKPEKPKVEPPPPQIIIPEQPVQPPQDIKPMISFKFKIFPKNDPLPESKPEPEIPKPEQQIPKITLIPESQPKPEQVETQNKQLEDIKKVDKFPEEIIKNTVKIQPDQHSELNMKIPGNNQPKIHNPENKHSDSKITFPKPPQPSIQTHIPAVTSSIPQILPPNPIQTHAVPLTQVHIPPLNQTIKITPILKAQEKPPIPKVAFKLETPNTPKQKRKVIDSDSDEMQQIEQIPIIKKNSEKKPEVFDTPKSSNNISAPIASQSSEKKQMQMPPFNLNNEVDNKTIGQQIELLQQKEAQKQQQPVKTEPQNKYTFKIDVNGVLKCESEVTSKKIEKNKKFAQKIMMQLKKFVLNRQPQLDILNKNIESPSLTSLQLILAWMKNDVDKFSFNEFSQISKYVQMAYKSIQFIGGDEDMVNQRQLLTQLQQCFDREREQEQIRLRKQEQEIKAQNEPIILEKIDIDQLCRTLRVRQKKKKGSEKGKDNDQVNKQEENQQPQAKQNDVQPFTLCPTKRPKLIQQPTPLEIEEEEDTNDEFNVRKYEKESKERIEKMKAMEKENQQQPMILRSLDQVQIQKSIQYGDQNYGGQFPKILVEKMNFFLLNRESTYFRNNKQLLQQLFHKLKELPDPIKEGFSPVSKSNYYVDENHTELHEIYKIDNYAEILIRLTLQDQDNFDVQQLEQKINIKLTLQNILSFRSMDNFVHVQEINKAFQLQLAQYSQQISEPILKSKLYDSNEIFIESLCNSVINKEAGFGIVICNKFKTPVNQIYEYSCHVQFLIPFTYLEDLKIALNQMQIFNVQYL